MGDSATGSITDLDGKFHGFDNAYVAGPALFPTLGSHNPGLTGLTLARRTAGAIVRSVSPPLPNGFTALSLDPADWKMVGRGGNPRMQRFGDVWETLDGYGLYWYTKEQFGNFTYVSTGGLPGSPTTRAST